MRTRMRRPASFFFFSSSSYDKRILPSVFSHIFLVLLWWMRLELWLTRRPAQQRINFLNPGITAQTRAIKSSREAQTRVNLENNAAKVLLLEHKTSVAKLNMKSGKGKTAADIILELSEVMSIEEDPCQCVLGTLFDILWQRMRHESANPPSTICKKCP